MGDLDRGDGLDHPESCADADGVVTTGVKELRRFPKAGFAGEGFGGGGD